ncbi:MFS transporter [Actinoplanes sp. NPDC051343]|uniref:MFS transporter n=1 Tax=Actinoplanes sp. NPDC051343 TaxID=3363906 RepID=UPI0037A4D2B0
MNVDGNDGALAGRREWGGFAVLMLVLLAVSMDTSVLYFAAPFISEQMHPSGSEQLWIFDIYGFVLSGLLLTMGGLADKIGRRRLLLLGALGFGAFSVMAAYSSSTEMLIAARALLGIGGATLMPSTLALVRNIFTNEKQRGTAVVIWTSVLSLGVTIGPVVSGALLNHFWWGSIFLVNVPVIALLLILGPILIPESRNPAAGRFDILSSLLSMATVLPIIYAMQHAASNGFSNDLYLYIVGGAVFGALFILRQFRARNPLIDIRLFKDRGFSGSVVIQTLAMFVLIGFVVFTTQFLQLVLGLNPLQAALWALIPSGAIIVAAPIGAIAGMKLKRSHAIAVGFLIAAAGYFGQSRVQPDTKLWYLLVVAFVSSAGVITLLALVGDLMLASIPADRAASASSVSETGQEFGGALGTAVLGSIGAHVFREAAADKLPSGLPADVAASAGQTISNAVSAAQQLGGSVGDELLRAARSAFSDAMSVAGLTAACVMVAGALLALVYLRNVRVAAPAQPGAEDATAVQPEPGDATAVQPDEVRPGVVSEAS